VSCERRFLISMGVPSSVQCSKLSSSNTGHLMKLCRIIDNTLMATSSGDTLRNQNGPWWMTAFRFPFSNYNDPWRTTALGFRLLPTIPGGRRCVWVSVSRQR
jgi:hypothetical protein